MSAPRVVAVAPSSPAANAAVMVGDEIVALNGIRPRDILEYQQLVDEAELTAEIQRGHTRLELEVENAAGQPIGNEIESARFDRVRTGDNHCEFCFIYLLPKGLRKSLYLKDDDYRLSLLYGNFTTLTRFTEADLERVVTERLSPLNVSIHAIDPSTRNEMLRNRRGGPTLRWLRALLDHDIEINGQIVVCPGLNDGAAFDDTLAGILEQFPEMASVCVVPLGVSKSNTEERMRSHTVDEARAVLEAVHDWQDVYLATLGRRLVFASDEYYLMAKWPFPPIKSYEEFSMHEDGVGTARTFESEFDGRSESVTRPADGFFAWVDGAPAERYRAPLATEALTIGPRRSAPVGVRTAEMRAQAVAPLIASIERNDVRIIEIKNEYFGGNVGVAGLMVGTDIAPVLANEPEGHRYLLPDVYLSNGAFLDAMTPAELPRPVEVISTDGNSLRAVLVNSDG